MNNRAIPVLTATLITVLASAAPCAYADSVKDEHHRMLIHFADLDLAKPAGIAALYGRLRGAAKVVCASLEGKDLESAAAFRQCVTDAVTQAVAEVDQPNLSAYYRAKSQGRNGTSVRIVASK
jgi:UrcA family protein